MLADEVDRPGGILAAFQRIVDQCDDQRVALAFHQMKEVISEGGSFLSVMERIRTFSPRRFAFSLKQRSARRRPGPSERPLLVPGVDRRSSSSNRTRTYAKQRFSYPKPSQLSQADAADDKFGNRGRFRSFHKTFAERELCLAVVFPLLLQPLVRPKVNPGKYRWGLGNELDSVSPFRVRCVGATNQKLH